MVSALDAGLLQRAEGYFTGGFLSTDHLVGAGEVVVFVVLSLVADGAVIGLIAGTALFAARRLRPRAASVAAFLAGTAPLVAANVVNYELVQYLGDAADLRLMFDLAGQSVGELAAVASGHLLTPGIVATSVVVACGGLVWVINRRGENIVLGRPPAKLLIVPALVFCVALGATAGAIASNERLQNGILRKPAGKVLALAADQLSDIDGDGFGVASRLVDPDQYNALVFPYAVDIPGNGVDEDGVGGDLPPDVAPYVESSEFAPWTRRPDVVLIVLESFRFDLLGAEYAGHSVTPVLDGVAKRGISSTRAYSHNGYTAQSRFHLLSGSLAGVNGGTTLIDDFQANGYVTVYVSGQDESFGGARYDSGFSRADVAIDARTDRDRRYTAFTTAGSLAVPFSVVEERVAESLARDVPRDRPLFLYVNFHDTHFPYVHEGIAPLTSSVRVPRRRIVPAERESIWATYVNTAANVDRAVGAVLDRVRRIRGAEPAVIVTSDHGESLFDDGFLGHGHALNDVQTQVPFIVANLPMIVEEPFGHVSLRRAVGAALRTPATTPALPHLLQSDSSPVFQYLGTVNRPRQIAFRTRADMIIYDFRSRRFQARGRGWVPERELAGDERSKFLDLVRYWERMLLARAARLADD